MRADDPEVLAEFRSGQAVQDVHDERADPADTQGPVEATVFLE